MRIVKMPNAMSVTAIMQKPRNFFELILGIRADHLLSEIEDRLAKNAIAAEEAFRRARNRQYRAS